MESKEIGECKSEQTVETECEIPARGIIPGRNLSIPWAANTSDFGLPGSLFYLLVIYSVHWGHCTILSVGWWDCLGDFMFYLSWVVVLVLSVVVFVKRKKEKKWKFENKIKIVSPFPTMNFVDSFLEGLRSNKKIQKDFIFVLVSFS